LYEQAWITFLNHKHFVSSFNRKLFRDNVIRSIPFTHHLSGFNLGLVTSKSYLCFRLHFTSTRGINHHKPTATLIHFNFQHVIGFSLLSIFFFFFFLFFLSLVGVVFLIGPSSETSTRFVTTFFIVSSRRHTSTRQQPDQSSYSSTFVSVTCLAFLRHFSVITCHFVSALCFCHSSSTKRSLLPLNF
jgi:hypothetical protein